jgi:MFS family permease
MSARPVGDIASWYLIGEVIGALFFGRLSDKLGRRTSSWSRSAST